MARKIGVQNDWAVELAAKLSSKTGKPVTAQDVNDWSGETGCGDGFEHVNQIVREYMGPRLFDHASVSARVIPVLCAKLDGLGQARIGGIMFSLDQTSN